MITSKQRSLIGLAALVAIASTQACSSDGSDTPAPQAGSPGAGGAHAGSASVAGAPAAGAPAGGAPAAGGTPAVAGTSAGGAPAGGTSAGGTSAGGTSAGGASGGSGGKAGGSSGGSAGKGNGGSGGGGSTVSYADVKAIFTASCGTTCHSGSPHTNFSTGDLYTTLSTPIPTTPAGRACKGSTLITANDGPGSLLVKIITGPSMTSCQNAGATQMIGRMPNNCSGNACLTSAQIKTISDWISAGAPH